MQHRYFSDREYGVHAQTEDQIGQSAWSAIRAIIQTLIDTGAFGYSYPKLCPDNQGVTGTNERAFVDAINGDVPGLDWPRPPHDTPATLDILDAVEFCFDSVAQPNLDDYHSYWKHHHLEFSWHEGREAFRQKVNRIFQRNALAYDLNADGNVVRRLPPVLDETLTPALFDTGDERLDDMLETARLKFLSPDASVRREAIERLWDAWERVKTLEDPSNKKASVAALLDNAADQPRYRGFLEAEARALTDAGNTFHIRHTEVGQEPVEDAAQIDYLFHRLFSFMWLLLKAR